MAAASEDYAAAHAEAAKQRGNAFFKEKDYDKSIEAYSEAIELDPENYVFYSNRSAVYLAKGDAKSKAFKDAEKCVKLSPTWAKGHSRKGAAEHALGRFAAAQASYARAIELEPETALFRAGLEAAKEGEIVDAERRKLEAERKAELEEKMSKLRAEEAERVRKREEMKKAETGNLDDFFAELGQAETDKKAEKRQETNPITEKYATQKLGTSAENVERLTGGGHLAKWRNLNPFQVMKLDTDATPDDIKMRYRKLSTLCHPDKNMGNEAAREAFEAVKDAYNALSLKKDRERAVLVMDSAKKYFYADRLAKLDKGIDEASMEPEEAALEKALMKVFAQNEMKRIDKDEHTRINNERERSQAEEKKNAEESEVKFEDQWNQDDRRSERLDFWQQFQDDSGRSGVQKRARTAKNFKQEEHVPKKKKHGEADMNSWKKEWK